MNTVVLQMPVGLKLFIVLFLFLSICSLSACSVPRLEQAECAAARDTVKRFYSFHFGNDMRPSRDNVLARAEFITTDLMTTLSASAESPIDYFTATDNYPKAFRVGSCSVQSRDTATLQVILLWSDDTASSQNEVTIETVNRGDRWLINKVTN